MAGRAGGMIDRCPTAYPDPLGTPGRKRVVTRKSHPAS